MIPFTQSAPAMTRIGRRSGRCGSAATSGLDGGNPRRRHVDNAHQGLVRYTRCFPAMPST